MNSVLTPTGIDLPVTRTVVAAKAILDAVRCGYDIDHITGCEMLKFHTNDTYLLTTENEPYILRLYGARWRSVPEIEYELALLRHVAAKGVPGSVPIQTRCGAWRCPIPAAEGERQLVVFTYVKGAPLTWETIEQCRQAGQTMAEMHEAMGDFQTEHYRRPHDLAGLTDRPLGALKPFLTSRPEAWEFLQRLATRLRARVEDLAADGLDWGVCHGDMAAKNLLHVEDRKLAVLDFDHCGNGWRAYDFAKMFGDAAWAEQDALWEAFWDGYVARRPLNETNKEAVPVFLTLRHLFMLGMMAENALDWGTVAIRDTNLDGWLTFLQQCEQKYLGGD